jgi:hypothetical protein
MQQSPKIVADGRERLREAGGYEDERRCLRAELARRVEFERANVSWWKRLWLEVRLRRAVHTELKKKFPPGALYVAA